MKGYEPCRKYRTGSSVLVVACLFLAMRTDDAIRQFANQTACQKKEIASSPDVLCSRGFRLRPPDVPRERAAARRGRGTVDHRFCKYAKATRLMDSSARRPRTAFERRRTCHATPAVNRARRRTLLCAPTAGCRTSEKSCAMARR